MGVLSWITGLIKPGRGSAEETKPALRWMGDGRFSVDAVGEVRYQTTLSKVAGGRADEPREVSSEAVLRFEPDNPHDRNAVAVFIDGAKIAYLRREDAVTYHAATRRLKVHGQDVTCAAKVVGGSTSLDGDGGDFAVKLDIAEPFQLAGSRD